MSAASRTAAGRLLQAAFAHQQKGQLAEARGLFTQVLALDGRNFDALQLLGLCCLQAGELEQARGYLDRALVLRQDVASVFNHRGIVLRRLGERDGALADFSRVIALKSGSAEAHYNRANTLRELGRLAEALADYRHAVALEPGRPEFLNNLGGCLKELERPGEALGCYDRLLALNPRAADAHANRGVVLQALGRRAEALAALDRATALGPGLAEAWSQRGGVLTELKRLPEAAASLERALDLDPAKAESWNLMGNLRIAEQQPEEALASYDRAIALRPAHAQAHANRGVVLMELGRPVEAAASFEAALALKPGSNEARVGLARLALEEGRFADAEARFTEVLRSDPRHVECLSGLAELRKFEAGDPLFARLEERLAADDLDDERRALLHHALGKISDDAGRHDDAMWAFARSKALTPARFDAGQHHAAYAAMKALFTPSFFQERRGFCLADERPVFVIGMPRSGTTLTEQILASHARVEGLGELQDLPRLSRTLGGGLGQAERFAQAVAAMTAADSRRLAERYCAAYRGCDPAAVRLVDKRPHNYELLGLIALLFPQARIVHCRRNAVDNCLSMYMQHFTAGHGYNHDLATLGHYYRAYESLMAHWTAVLPLPIHDCVYEETVSDVEASARSLVSFIGLDWDANCLRYHEQGRSVRTPSLWQVRQPVYRSSVERWRRYEAHLGPLLAALGQ